MSYSHAVVLLSHLTLLLFVELVSARTLFQSTLNLRLIFVQSRRSRPRQFCGRKFSIGYCCTHDPQGTVNAAAAEGSQDLASRTSFTVSSKHYRAAIHMGLIKVYNSLNLSFEVDQAVAIPCLLKSICGSQGLFFKAVREGFITTLRLLMLISHLHHHEGSI